MRAGTQDLAENGTIHFDEAAEERAFSPHLYSDADDIQQALTAIDRCLT